ncbi:MAG TPA: hypothetical protein VFZ89_14470 [Solirubrobacteraceae bacterium]
MRTTVTLDPDTRLLVERAMRERGVSFKQALNDAVRTGLAANAPSPQEHTTPSHMGEPLVDLTKALALSSELEDEALVRKLAEGR